MKHSFVLWIFIVQICRVQSANGYDVTSPGALIGIVLVAIVMIMIIVTIIVVCLKKHWRKQKQRQKRKTKVKTNSKKEIQQKTFTITESLIERLPDIPEEDETIGVSCVSIRDETKLTLFHIEPVASNSETDDICKESLHKNKAQKIIVNDHVSIDKDEIQMNSKESETYETKEDESQPSENDVVKDELQTNSKVAQTSKTIEDEKQPSDNDVVKSLRCENDSTQDINSEVSITRVIKNESALRKDVPFLNSTENIFSEYDPAMTYKTESEWKSKSDEGLHLKCTTGEPKNLAPRAFEVTRDDSDLNLKSDSLVESEDFYETQINSCCSEGTLTNDKKTKSLKRRSSFISKVTNKSFQWNFDYISPYAMTDKQKRERYMLKIQNRKRRLQALKQKMAEKEKKEFENRLAFEKWKQQKLEGKSKHYQGDIGSFKTMNFNKYKYWYP